MSDAPRWLAGEARHRAAALQAVAALQSGGPGLVPLADKPGRRRLARVDGTPAGPLFLKEFAAASGPLAAVKRALGWSPDAREWRMLVRLHGAGLSVPEPVAHLALAGGERIVVTRFVAGVPFAEALRAPARARRALLAELAALVRRLHACGVVHRDLHVGNLLATPHGVMLLDLQAALPVPLRGARLLDLGELDASLATRVSHADRTRVAAGALGLARPFDARARARLRDVARARLARARAHWQSRTRRSLRAGRQYAPFSLGGAHGLRLRDLPEARITALLSGDPRDPRAREMRDPVRVQRFHARSAFERLAQALRGTPARHAWCAAAGLRARGIACERPLAYLERRRFGFPLESVLVLETLPAADPAAAAAGLARLRAQLRERDVAHGALDVDALRAAPGGGLALARLEAVRFVRSAP